MRDLVKSYFEDNSIVNHHIASFNDFLASADNLNSRMQKIVDDIRVPNEDAERGVIVLDKDRVGNQEIKIRIGRKRDEEGKISSKTKGTIRVGSPEVNEANGYRHTITPMEARLRNLNYSSPIFLDFTIIPPTGAEQEENDVYIGNLPMMVKSRGCNLCYEAVREQKRKETGIDELSEEEYLQRLIDAKEDPRDSGGYFIIGGTERVLITDRKSVV